MGGVIVAVSWCNRISTCAYCGEEVEKAAPILVKKVWSSKSKRQYRFSYHLLCWIKETLDYLQQFPYEAVARRRLADLTDEDRIMRRKLLARRATIRQRIRGWENHQDQAKAIGKIADLMSKEIEIANQISEVGGIPKSWSMTEPQ